MKIKSKAITVMACILLLFTFIQKVLAQQKRMPTIEDYKLWNLPRSTVYGQLSNNGNWIMYRSLPLQNGTKDTLYVKNVITGTKYNLPNGSWGTTFSPDSKWFTFMNSDTLSLLDLASGKKQLLTGVSSPSFTSDSRYMVTNHSDAAGTTIWIKDLKTTATITIKNVKEFSLSPDQKMLAMVTEEGTLKTVKSMVLKSGMPSAVLASGDRNTYSTLTWNKAGNSLAFYEQFAQDKQQPVVYRVHVCRDLASKPLIKVLDPLTSPEFPKGLSPVLSGLYMSDDGKQLFLYLKPIKADNVISEAKDQTKSDVEIWRPDDKKVPYTKERATSDTQWYVWWMDFGKVLPLADDAQPNAALTGDQKHVLLYNGAEYQPQYKYVGVYIDLYIKDLLTGLKKMVLKKTLNERGSILVSPGGKYVTYFKDKNWWVYDIEKDTHKCVTKDLNVPFENIEHDYSGLKPAYGIRFMDGDSELMIYDQFDIWLIRPDGSKRIKITEGRAINTTYRIYEPGGGIIIQGPSTEFNSKRYSAEAGMLVKTVNKTNLDEGFCWWSKQSGLSKMVEKAKRISPMSNLGYKKTFLFAEEDFDVSPRLVLRDPSGTEKLIYQSNPQQKDYYWGKSELINYTTSDGKQLKGALFYPANYDPGKKYPMIVNIYERKSDDLHKYPSPIEAYTGHNLSNFTLDGYVVLYPDIAYDLNDPGISALRCVVAAVEKVLEKGIVDKDRIGLTGHSHGGFETTFIISQTNLFKTAIAGAPVADLMHQYLSYGDFGSNIARFENQQMRLQAPFYGEDFRRNSPIMNVEHINTPLLLWHGDKDFNVDLQHSTKLQIGLWRLGKKSTLLVYPGEPHVLFKEINQKDLTMRVKDWFGYYLKGEKPAEWMHISEETK